MAKDWHQSSTESVSRATQGVCMCRHSMAEHATWPRRQRRPGNPARRRVYPVRRFGPRRQTNHRHSMQKRPPNGKKH